MNLNKTTKKKLKETTKPEDIVYNGIKYSDYKAVIAVAGATGEQKIEFTTWRADIITAIMREGLVLQVFAPGDVLTIEAAPCKKE